MTPFNAARHARALKIAAIGRLTVGLLALVLNFVLAPRADALWLLNIALASFLIVEAMGKYRMAQFVQNARIER